MQERKTGTYERTKVGGEDVAAFIPAPLPPKRPNLAIEGAIAERLGAAEQALVRLELAGERVPSLDCLIYAFVRKEAVVSSEEIVGRDVSAETSELLWPSNKTLLDSVILIAYPSR